MWKVRPSRTFLSLGVTELWARHTGELLRLARPCALAVDAP